MDILSNNSYHEFIFDDNTIKIYATRNDYNTSFNIIIKMKNTNNVIERCIMTIDELFNKIKNFPICYIDGYFFYNMIEKQFE